MLRSLQLPPTLKEVILTFSVKQLRIEVVNTSPPRHSHHVHTVLKGINRAAYCYSAEMRQSCCFLFIWVRPQGFPCKINKTPFTVGLVSVCLSCLDKKTKKQTSLSVKRSVYVSVCSFKVIKAFVDLFQRGTKRYMTNKKTRPSSISLGLLEIQITISVANVITLIMILLKFDSK